MYCCAYRSKASRRTEASAIIAIVDDTGGTAAAVPPPVRTYGPCLPSRRLRARWRQPRMPKLSASHPANAANGQPIAAGHSTAITATTANTIAVVSQGTPAASPSTRRLPSAALTLFAIRNAPAAARPELPPARAVLGARGVLLRICSPRRKRRGASTISVAFWRSSSYWAASRPAKPASSTAMSISKLPSQLEMLRLEEPTRAHWPSATAVFACNIEPFHSNTRMPGLQKRPIAAAGHSRQPPGYRCCLGQASARRHRHAPPRRVPAHRVSRRRNRHRKAIGFCGPLRRSVDQAGTRCRWRAAWQ